MIVATVLYLYFMCVVRESFYEELTVGQDLKDARGTSRWDIWARIFQAEGMVSMRVQSRQLLGLCEK